MWYHPKCSPFGEWGSSTTDDMHAIKSNTFTIEWPPKSGRLTEFPEIDRAEFFDLATARTKIKAGQEGFLDELEVGEA
jgi:predicted NUDIX family NTP pyrophosphohydrolase